MQVTRRSLVSGKWHTRELPVTEAQLTAYLLDGGDLMVIFADLPPEEREFIKTGITPEEWEQYVRTSEDEEDEADAPTDETLEQ